MAERSRWSVARTVVVGGLVVQFLLTLMQILVSYSVATWITRIANRETEALLGTLALVVLLALVRPAARGRPWALSLSVALQAVLTYEMVPWLVRKFHQPENYLQWFLNLSYCVTGAAAAVFGVVALLEATGRTRPVAWRTAGGLTRQGVVALAVASAFAGALVAGAGMADRPTPTSTVVGAADEVLLVGMERMSFAPHRLELPAGKRVALVLVNRARDEHSFDVASQNVHVVVPGGRTGLAVVQVPATGEIPFYCGIPGHTEAGMTGVIAAR